MTAAIKYPKIPSIEVFTLYSYVYAKKNNYRYKQSVVQLQCDFCFYNSCIIMNHISSKN